MSAIFNHFFWAPSLTTFFCAPSLTTFFCAPSLTWLHGIPACTNIRRELDDKIRHAGTRFYINKYKKSCDTKKVCFMLGADFKSNQTTKQLKNSISANRKVETNLTCFLLVQIKLFNCLVVWLFLKSAPWKMILY